ncbi:unnamed protein product [Brassicogethes aeneus]|uniref:ACB domain-containing protein n=1 Tax=Brassicogethes aeneus TaxID=1431903 RepID=A0A9P0B6G3_BRAAE|nr:unnamed protein product [Brassicogethes aeneus]
MEKQCLEVHSIDKEGYSSFVNSKMSLDENFNKAAESVKNLKSKPSDNDLLELYGLFKQATVGDNTTPRPGMLDLKGKAKHDAWTARKGKSQDDAKEAYVKKAEALIASLGCN